MYVDLATPRNRKRTLRVINSGYESQSEQSAVAESFTNELDLGSGAFQRDDDGLGETWEDLDASHSVKRRKLSHIEPAGPPCPRCEYQGWEPPCREVLERDAIRELTKVHAELHASEEELPEYTYLKLEQFNIYRPTRSPHKRAADLASLDQLQTRRGCSELMFDGVLSCGTERRYVRDILFSVMTIEGYGDPTVVSLAGRICIQSPLAREADVWYQFSTPSPEYERFFSPFFWLAQFAKHFADYLLETQHVTLRHFRQDFWFWLHQRHTGSREFTSWRSQVNFTDFCTTVAANVGYLWKECYDLDTADDVENMRQHPIWGEVDAERLTAIPERPSQETKTVVSPFAHDMFRRMYFLEAMTKRDIEDPDVIDQVAGRKQSLGLTPLDTAPIDKQPLEKDTVETTDLAVLVEVGDVICVKANPKGAWKHSGSIWYAYIQAKYRNTTGEDVFDVLWLYQPADTTIGKAYYPYKNELFLSDNCSCGKDAVHIDAVICKLDVEFFVTNPSRAKGLFVRQKFRTVHDEDTYDFLALSKTDFRCACQHRMPIYEECRQRLEVHQTVLVRRREKLEPAQIITFEDAERQIRVRLFDRKKGIDLSAPPNELLFTDTLVMIQPSHIIRKCHVGVFEMDRIPSPYDRGGAGDFYYVVRAQQDPVLVGPDDLPALPESLDPQKRGPFPELKGMGIFCGGGNLDRGLEDGGAVKFRYAIDWLNTALHSYRANLENPDSVHFWSGSVNDYLAEAFCGSVDLTIARPGDINLLSAGSPCPGFSALQQNKLSAQSLTNASMVASVISYVDFYSPEYCVLENVVTMTWGMGANKDENVFAQLLAAFVALGYQVQQFLMDPPSFGSSQQRSRVFLVASAPGLAPWPAPPYTHSHPAYLNVREKNLGRSSNGKPFGARRIDDVTPFTYVSVIDAVGELPKVADSMPQICPSFPDHRLANVPNNASRTRVAVVPVRPRGQGLLQTFRSGLLSGEPKRYCEALREGSVRAAEDSKTFSRVDPNGLFYCITTRVQSNDGRLGRVHHWAEHRQITVMELRRAQGFLDYEVIVGSPVEQVVIIGNSVDRKVSFALGMALRESWEKTNAPKVAEKTVAEEHDEHQDMSVQQQTTPRQQDWVAQSRAGTLRLSPIQIEDIKRDGFKAIRRILAESPSRSRSVPEVPWSL